MRELPRELTAEELAELFEGRTTRSSSGSPGSPTRCGGRARWSTSSPTTRSGRSSTPTPRSGSPPGCRSALRPSRERTSTRLSSRSSTGSTPTTRGATGSGSSSSSTGARRRRSWRCSAAGSTTRPRSSSRPRSASSATSRRIAGGDPGKRPRDDRPPARSLRRAARLARPRPALAARDRGDGVDRHVVLLRPPRPVAPSAEGRRRRRRRGRRRALGGARRRLLPRAEVRRRPARAARPPGVVQVGGLRDVALGLRADARPLLPRGVERARQAGRRPRAVARGHDLDRAARRRLDRLRRAQPARLRRPRPVARAVRPRRAVGVGVGGALQPARGLAPGRRDDRDGDGCERLLRHHPRPLGADPSEGGGPRARPGAGHPGEAALGAQQLPDPAGCPHDAGRPLPLRVRRGPRVARPRGADG